MCYLVVLRHYLLFVQFNDTMDNRNVPTLYFEHNNLTNADGFFLVVGKEQEITSMEGWFHTATKYHHNWALTTRNHHQSLPDHQGGGYNHSKT